MKIIIAGLIFSSSMASAGELYDIKLPDADQVEGKSLVLNGMAVREASILGISIRVYVAGLYIEKKSADGEAILNSSGLKQMKTVFKHRASASDVKDAWEESFNAVCKAECSTKHRGHFQTFKTFFKTVKSGDDLIYTFSSKGLEVRLNEEKWGFIDDSEFGRIILSVWIGKDAVSSIMKKGLLGG